MPVCAQKSNVYIFLGSTDEIELGDVSPIVEYVLPKPDGHQFFKELFFHLEAICWLIKVILFLIPLKLFNQKLNIMDICRVKL